MAITFWRPRDAAPPLTQAFTTDSALLQSRAAQEARRRGVLQAKEEALRAAETLLGWGRLLSWGIIFVSGIHIWESVASIAPKEVGHLALPGPVYHLAALGFTLMIDAVALFVSRANAVAALVGAQASRWTIYFYLVAALLNAAFVASHAPSLDAATQAQVLPLLSALFVILLPISVPAGIVAVERSRQTLEGCRLTLLAEVATLHELCAPGVRRGVGESVQNASQSVLGGSGQPETGTVLAVEDPGGRPLAYSLDDLVIAFAPEQDEERFFGPSDVRRQLNCSDTTARRLIQSGCEAGRIERAGRGAYRVRGEV